MNPSKMLVRNLINFELISLLELRGFSKFKCFFIVIVATRVQQAVATTIATTIFLFCDLSWFFYSGLFPQVLKSCRKDQLQLLMGRH
jgi:hypothetical protein